MALAMQDLHFEKWLGDGYFSSVSLFKYKDKLSDKTLYTAVKTSYRNHVDSLRNEFQILSKFKGSPRIVQCYGTNVQMIHNDDGDLELNFPMEYASGGSLKSFMDRFKDRKLPYPMIKDFTRMILQGLVPIHGHGYVHCNLEPGNILVFPSRTSKTFYELKISDFAKSKRAGDYSWWHPNRPFVGTPIYMSHESIGWGETRAGLDLWSLGCVVLEMYTGKRPWWHKDFALDDLKNCYVPLIPSDLPCDAKLFIKTCFALKFEERKDALTLLEHSFLREDLSKNENPKNIALGLEKISEERTNALTLLERGFLREDASKNEKPKNIALELEKIRQKLAEIRSIRVIEL